MYSDYRPELLLSIRLGLSTGATAATTNTNTVGILIGCTCANTLVACISAPNKGACHRTTTAAIIWMAFMDSGRRIEESRSGRRAGDWLWCCSRDLVGNTVVGIRLRWRIVRWRHLGRLICTNVFGFTGAELAFSVATLISGVVWITRVAAVFLLDTLLYDIPRRNTRTPSLNRFTSGGTVSARESSERVVIERSDAL
jgi:hypothetical protein